MKRAFLAAAMACAVIAPAQAEESQTVSCAQEVHVRDTATEIEATEVVPLRSRSGRQYLMLVLQSGEGLVMAKSETGCFDVALAMSKDAVSEVLSQSAPS